MQVWLTSHGVPFPADLLKTELYNLVKKNKPQSKHVVDEMAGQQGFLVLCWPVGHCKLNPIELIWAQKK